MLNIFRRFAKKFRLGRGFFVGLRYAMDRGNPGAWASDHREETQHVTGWNYVAIKAKGIQAMQASVSVYQAAEPDEAKARRQNIRKNFGSYGRYKTLYGNEADTSRELSATHPLVKLLKRPNPQQSGASFRYEQILQLESTGTCLVWNVPNQFGLTVERYVIPTAMAAPIPPAENLPRGGWRVDSGAWRISFSSIAVERFQSFGDSSTLGPVIPAEHMQAVRWPHPFYKDDGYSPLAAAALWIDGAEQIDRTRWNQMRNQASPSLIIAPSSDIEPNEEELDRAAKKFNEKYSGSEGAGKAMFLSGASTVTQIGPTPKDMGYDNGFVQMRDAVLGVHGVPPIAAGIAGGGSYAAYYAQLKQFTALTVQPILELLAEEDTERLAPQFGPNLTIEYEAAAIDDPDVLEKRLATDIAARAITKQELRALRGLPPFGDERDQQFAGQGTQEGKFTTQGRNEISAGDRYRTTHQSGPPRPENGKAPKWHNRLTAIAEE